VSRENVELVRKLQAPPGADIALMARDEAIAAALTAYGASLLHEDVECTYVRFDSTKTYRGTDGMRALWRDWMLPWASYRTEIEELIDLDDRVLVLARDFARREGSTSEIALIGGALYTVRDGRVSHIAYYSDRAEALKAVGLEE
jgi:hypothetical protein